MKNTSNKRYWKPIDILRNWIHECDLKSDTISLQSFGCLVTLLDVQFSKQHYNSLCTTTTKYWMNLWSGYRHISLMLFFNLDKIMKLGIFSVSRAMASQHISTTGTPSTMFICTTRKLMILEWSTSTSDNWSGCSVTISLLLTLKISLGD